MGLKKASPFPSQDKIMMVSEGIEMRQTYPRKHQKGLVEMASRCFDNVVGHRVVYVRKLMVIILLDPLLYWSYLGQQMLTVVYLQDEAIHLFY